MASYFWLNNTSNIQVNNACNVAPDCSNLLETSKLKKLMKEKLLLIGSFEKQFRKEEVKKIKYQRTRPDIFSGLSTLF